MIVSWVIFGLFWHFFFLNLSTEPKEYTEYTYMSLYQFLTSENLNKKYLSKFYMISGSEIRARATKLPNSRHGANRAILARRREFGPSRKKNLEKYFLFNFL